jgi:hypothetical protein
VKKTSNADYKTFKEPYSDRVLAQATDFHWCKIFKESKQCEKDGGTAIPICIIMRKMTRHSMHYCT